MYYLNWEIDRSIISASVLGLLKSAICDSNWQFTRQKIGQISEAESKIGFLDRLRN